ncbi:low affinity immunoglobulin gamma Fc region receptor III-A-like [Cebidichthys violaceus]|uniref:low affinity immunoglobulin gamma Fc region receptor III-A-like n=1 Tax=Cebidichthys violaceus TaxID=271503 RepID=UPI0035CB3E3F
MGITSLCLMLSTLVIHPNRSQFFLYDSITLTCGGASRSGGWTFKRNTSLRASQLCDTDWGVSNESSCVIEDAYPSDSGVYWCESELGECSNSVSVNVTVTGGDVILESPALPVTEGDEVTLLCTNKEGKNGNNPSAKFFKDGVSIGTRAAGNVTFVKVSRSDEGLYHCELPTGGTSPQSWLAVQVRAEPPPLPLMPVPRLVCGVLLVVVHVVMFIVCVTILRKLAKARASSRR